MNLSLDNIDVILSEVNRLTEKNLFEEACKIYKMSDHKIKKEMHISFITDEKRRGMLARFYSSYAYFLFDFSEYALFFEMYIQAQKYGFSPEERKRFIYTAFIEPNINVLKENYEANVKNLLKNGKTTHFLEFEKLPYWLITTGKVDQYYLYNKETNLIKEKILFSINDDFPKIEITESQSDYLIFETKTWSDLQTYIININSQEKKSFILISNLGKLLSCFQAGIINKTIIDKILLFHDVEELKRYFISTSTFLPRNFIGADEDKIKYTGIVEKIHKHRLNKERETGVNTVLSICIPSYNRGKRAYNNIIHTLNSELDYEIEVVLSNNGTKNDTKEYYEKIKNIKDSRLTYFAFNENQGYAANLCKAIELATGTYVLLLSDEDKLDLNQLRYIVSVLNTYKETFSMVRTKSDGQGFVPFIGITKTTKDSLFNFMLTSNYMSGIIFNRELLIKYDLLKYILDNLDNKTCFNYPHMVWELILCQYGNVWGADIVLVNEGQPEKTEVETVAIGKNTKIMPYYSTVEGRLEQHKGFFDVIKDLEISKNDFEVLRALYLKLCGKTIFLVNLSINVYYRHTDVNVKKILEEANNISVEYLEKLYEGKKRRNKNKFQVDLNQIKNYYTYYRARL